MMRFVFLTIVFFWACGNSAVEAEDAKRIKQNRERDSIQNTPDLMYARVLESYEQNNYVEFEKRLGYLKQRHLISAYCNKGDSLKTEFDARRKVFNAKCLKALETMHVKSDKITGVTWYRDKSAPSYINQNGVYLKFNSLGSLTLVIQYYGDDWLFIKNYIVKVDSQTFNMDKVEVERDNDSKVWEWTNINIDPYKCDMINALYNANEVVVRLNGKQYFKDMELSKKQIAALKNTIEAYWGSGGKVCKN